MRPVTAKGTLTAHNWQNEKVDSLHVPAIKLYRVEAFGLSLFNLYFKKYDFCE